MVDTVRRTPERDQTIRLYQSVVDADRDRAVADITAVEGRLMLFGFGTAPDALIRDAALWLIRWVAAEQPAGGPRQDQMEAKAVELRDHVDLMSARSRKDDRREAGNSLKLAEEAGQLGEEYRAVWRSLLYESA
jgi:hypothetical protein